GGRLLRSRAVAGRARPQRIRMRGRGLVGGGGRGNLRVVKTLTGPGRVTRRLDRGRLCPSGRALPRPRSTRERRGEQDDPEARPDRTTASKSPSDATTRAAPISHVPASLG